MQFADNCKEVVELARNDSSKIDWVTFKYATKSKLEVNQQGSGGFNEFRASLAEDACTWAFLRMYSGDQESRRAKFILVQYNGSQLGGMAKSRAGVNKPDVEAMVGQHHLFFFAEGLDELTEELVMEKIKKSAGANYDLGSNSKGYESKAGDIKASAASNYKTKEKEGNAGPVSYCDTALPASTPCDLAGRPTVAPSTELKKNYDLKGKLDVDKWQGAEGSKPVVAPKATGQPAKKWEPVKTGGGAAPAPTSAAPVNGTITSESPKKLSSTSSWNNNKEEDDAKEEKAPVKAWVPNTGSTSKIGKAFEARNSAPEAPQLSGGRAGGGGESKALTFDSACREAVADVRSDGSNLDWVALKYASRSQLVMGNKGSGGFAEFKSSLAEDACTWAFLRMYSGDQESRRAKFILVQYNGSQLGGMAKSRAGVNKPDVEAMVGQHHLFFFAEGLDELTEELVMEKIKKSAGANYDLGSNSKGYESKAGDIKASAASNYKTKEKEGNAGPVSYCDTALPASTPCDLAGRPTVAPSTELKKNYDLKGKLDVDKWNVKGEAGESSDKNSKVEKKEEEKVEEKEEKEEEREGKEEEREESKAGEGIVQD